MTDKQPHEALGRGGRWEAITETSRYVLDLDAGTARRIPGEGLGGVPGLIAPVVTDLRGDCGPVPLIEVAQAVVGASMVLLLQLRDDDVVTVRVTSVVRAIRPLGGEDR